MTRTLICIFAVVASFSVAVAAAPTLKVEQPIDRRLRIISEQLRCPVCQSENIYDSKASLAHEMRAIVREKLALGQTDEEIINFFVDRYGTYVLQEPPKSGLPLLLWVLPFVGMVLGVLALTLHLRRSQSGSTETSGLDEVEGQAS